MSRATEQLAQVTHTPKLCDGDIRFSWSAVAHLSCSKLASILSHGLETLRGCIYVCSAALKLSTAVEDSHICPQASLQYTCMIHPQQQTSCFRCVSPDLRNPQLLCTSHPGPEVTFQGDSAMGFEEGCLVLGQGYIWLAHRNIGSPAWDMAVHSKQLWGAEIAAGNLSSAIEWQVGF